MLLSKIEKIKNLLYKKLDPTDTKQVRYIKSILVAVKILIDPQLINDYIVDPTHHHDRLLKKQEEIIRSSEHNPLVNMLIDTALNNPEVFEEAIKLTRNELTEYVFEADTDDFYKEPHLNADLSKLVLGLLNIKDHNTVANFGFNCGIFEINSCLFNNNAHYISTTSNDSLLNFLTQLRGDRLKSFSLNQNFDLFNLSMRERFDRIFTFAPLGLQAKSLQFNDFMGKTFHEHPEYKNANLAEWFYVLKTLHHLHEDGTAVVLLSNGATWNTLDKQIRKDLVMQGVIKAVITLPEKVIKGIHCSTTLLVLKRNSTNVSMIDASQYYIPYNKQNSLGQTYINHILSLIDTNTECSQVVSIQDIANEDFVLNPIRYTTSNELKNTVLLKDLLISPLTRGKNISTNTTTSQIDNYNQYRFLTLSDITDGHINNSLSAITDIHDLQTDKYVVNINNLVISKSKPFKTAVMTENTNTIASDNMFIIKVDTSKINPYYLKAYFESEPCQKELKRVSSGTNTNILSKEQLENLRIPLPSMDEQNKIAEEYKELENEIINLKQKLEILKSAQKSVWR